MGGPIDMEQKAYESMWYWTYYMILTFDSTHDLGLRSSCVSLTMV